MSARYTAWIRIGGTVERAKTESLLEAIRQAYVKVDWGEAPLEPTGPDDLLAVRSDERLWLCDEEAKYGEFPKLEETCRNLGLAYQRFCEGWCGYDAEITDWRPGMDEPLIRTCSNEDSEIVLVDASTVVEALTAIEEGRCQEAIGRLRSLCPQVPDLPPFEIV